MRPVSNGIGDRGTGFTSQTKVAAGTFEGPRPRPALAFAPERFYISKTMEIMAALRILSALAQTTRLSVFRLLVRAGEEGSFAGDIADALSVPAPTLSFHLKELAQCGLIEARREGRSIRYVLRADRMRAFLEFLSEDCCQGHPELCLPKRERECSRSERS